MKRIITTYAIAFGLLNAAVASPAPQDPTHDTPSPNPSLTFSLRNPSVTDFTTQNATTTTAPNNTSTSTPATLTEIASFTAPNGGQYGATAIGGAVRIAGYELHVGGPDALVGGVRVSAAEEGLVHAGSTAGWATATGEVGGTATSGAEAESTSAASSSSEVAGETGSATESETSASETASEAAASASASEASGGAAGGKSRGAVSALAGIAGLLWMFG